MSAMRGLKFSNIPTKSNDPIGNRRMQLVKKLEEQKLLAADPNYVRKSTRFVGKGEARHSVVKEQRVRAWTKPTPDGGLVFSAYVAARPVELAKGFHGVQVSSRDELPEAIDKIIVAVRAGELDAAITTAATKSKKGMKKAA